MIYRIHVGAAPVADVEAILEFVSRSSPEAANRLAAQFEKAMDSLIELPNRYALAPEAETHGKVVRHLIIGNYRIIFMVIIETVHILRVRHTAQAPLSPDELY